MNRHAIWLIVILFALGLVISCGGGGGKKEKEGDGNGGQEPQNNAPVADAGVDRITLLDTKIILSGEGSHDPDWDPITCTWTILESPVSSSALLSGSATVYPSLIADVEGVYLLSLTVNDGTISSQADTVKITAASGTSNLPDTGMKNFYGDTGTITFPSPGQDFYGQDAQYSTNPMTFVDNGTTVTDQVTGLTWQKGDDGSLYNWYEASGIYHSSYNASSSNYCGSLNLGGLTNWRLPKIEEYLSIIVYGSNGNWSSPSRLHPDYFQMSTGYVHLWTAEKWSQDASYAWALFVPIQTNMNPKSTTHSVLCVNGPIWDTNSFTNNGNGTISDSDTGLMWQQADAGVRLKWKEALAYCDSLSLGGHQDWRLPDIKELESLANVSSEPAINLAYFPFPSKTYYSSTTHIDPFASRAATRDFSTGYIKLGYDKITELNVRCVR